MKKSRFTESQIVAVLKEGDAGVPVAQLVRSGSTPILRTLSLRLILSQRSVHVEAQALQP
jgi:hypothetical protein